MAGQDADQVAALARAHADRTQPPWRRGIKSIPDARLHGLQPLASDDPGMS
jgi:hypothetical protein